MKGLRTFFIGLVSLIVPVAGFADPEQTDPEKLQRVYAMYREYKEKFPAVEDISAAQARRLLEAGKKVVFVDVRRSAEMQVSSIRDAISKEEFLQDGIAAYDNYTVIGYCTISYRSGNFARDLAESGRNIYNLKGGLLAWTLEGGQVYNSSGPVKSIHVYGDTWNLAPGGYETTSFPLWKQFLPFGR